MKIGKVIFAALMLLPLAGCAGDILKSTEPQTTIYSLRPIEPTGDVPSDVLARTLEISSPSVPPGMEQDRIALFLDDGTKLDYYAGAKWTSSLDHVIREFTRRSASAVLPYVVAVTPEQSIPADYRLQIKINEFQPVYAAGSTAAPLLKANFEFTLVRLPTDQIVTSFTLSKGQLAQENGLDSITLGLEDLLQEIEREAFEKIDSKLRVK